MGLGGHRPDVAAQVGLGEADLRRALGQHADAEHGDVAAVREQVGNEVREAAVDVDRLDAEILGELARQRLVDPGELAALGVAERDPVVVGPDADPDRAGRTDPLEPVCTGGGGLSVAGSVYASLAMTSRMAFFFALIWESSSESCFSCSGVASCSIGGVNRMLPSIAGSAALLKNAYIE